MTRLSRLLRPKALVSLAVVLILLPLDLLIILSLWLSEAVYLPLRLVRKDSRRPSKPRTEQASILILNWDGRHLLQEFLPSVLEAVRRDGRNHEVIVVDNGSRDGSVEFLTKCFPQVRVVPLSRNCRFTGGNNAGVQAASHDVVIFLNNDMQVDPDFIDPLLRGFVDDSVFSVACQVFFQDKERRREETGKTKGRWRRGFIDLLHDQIVERDKNQGWPPIFWGGGGSCAFDRNKFLAIGGLDTLYDPFYLEDTDLSYQAWKRGWRSVLAVDSVVVHRHRGTNKQKFGDNYVDNTIRKNQYLFIWKNITDLRWTLAHSLCLPFNQYRFMLQTSAAFEVKAFFRALLQLPEGLLKRYRRRPSYRLTDRQIFELTSDLKPLEGLAAIDFSQGDFSEQIGLGWYEKESDGQSSFRWMSREGRVYLFPRGNEQYLEIWGTVPEVAQFRKAALRLKLYQNGQRMGQKRWFRGQQFRLKVPLRACSDRCLRFDLNLNGTFCPARLGRGDDQRELGLIVQGIRLV
ncbi:MAG: glycosyltransferase family 2 protein [Acidobacteriota bacterium]